MAGALPKEFVECHLLVHVRDGPTVIQMMNLQSIRTPRSHLSWAFVVLISIRLVSIPEEASDEAVSSVSASAPVASSTPVTMKLSHKVMKKNPLCLVPLLLVSTWSENF